MISYEFNCLNCLKKGHKSSYCTLPIKSYGIIAFKKNKDILLVQRRYTISYVDVMRGRYRDSDINSIFQRMTEDERNTFLLYSFEQNSQNLWLNNSKKFQKERAYAKEKFSSIISPQLNKLLETKSAVKEPPFLFPKGRKNTIYETEKNCALREFSEETGYSMNDVKIINDSPYKESFTGTDGIRYEQFYWLACFSGSDIPPPLDEGNIDQIGEVRCVKWFSYEDALHHLDTHKKTVLMNTEKLMKKFINTGN